MSSAPVSAQDSGTTTAAAEAIPFAEMASACPSTSVDAAHRLDPYWFGLWTGGSQVSWTSRALAVRLADAGVGRLRRADARVSPEQAMEAMCVPKLRARRCAVLAAIGLWRTLTAEQIAAIVGAPALAASPGDLRTAWSAGVGGGGQVRSINDWHTAQPGFPQCGVPPGGLPGVHSLRRCVALQRVVVGDRGTPMEVGE